MVIIKDFFWSFSIVSILYFYLVRVVMEALPLSLQIPLSPPSSLSWVTNMMFHEFGGIHCQHQHETECLVDVIKNDKVNAQAIKSRKRPAMLVLPEYCPEKVFSPEKRKIEDVEVANQGKEYCLLSKKGRRENMEDRYKFITDSSGDQKQAFFAVVDGHGGQAAADYVADNLGKNIMSALENQTMEEVDEHAVEQAIHNGYMETDKGFLSQGVNSGACAASVLIRNGEVHAANVGDCRVVLSRRGLATRLTDDHHLSREDERFRIENSGGFVHSCNGVWRVQGTLAVSRAIGNLHLKEWIISEPDVQKVPLTSDCEFLIIASDGLWDKVSDQEAVEVVLKEGINEMESCKKLVQISSSRGNRDDITIIVINLQKFMTFAHE